MGGQAVYRPHWMDKFESPILARLAWWKAQAQHREYVQAQQAAHEAVMAAKIEEAERNRLALRSNPNTPVRLVDSDWLNT